MESVSVRQRLRPLRYAMVIPAGDADAFVRAVALNTALWGGVYNPIVEIGPTLTAILTAFDVDAIVNLSGEGMPAEIAQAFQFRILEPEGLLRDIQPGDRRQRTLAAGFGVERIYEAIATTDLRDAGARSCAAVPVEIAETWRPWAAATFGSLEGGPPVTPELGAAYRRFLRSTDVAVRPQEDTDYRDRLFQIDVTRWGLREFGSWASVSSHVAFVGDPSSVGDLTVYWNVRATGRFVWFAPITAIDAHATMLTDVLQRGRYAINPNVENKPEIQKAPSVALDAFEGAVERICDIAGHGVVVNQHTPRFGFTAPMFGGDIRVATIEATSTDDVSLFDDGRLSPVRLIDPPYLDRDESGMEHVWAVELQIANPYSDDTWTCQLPNAPGVGSLVHRVVVGATDVHLGSSGIVLTEQRPRSRVYMSAVRTFDVFEKLLGTATGLTIQPSRPGRYAEQIIRRMGSLGFDCRLFKLRGVRDVINRLSSGATLTRGNMHSIVTSEKDDAFGRNWRPELYADLYVKRGQTKLDFSVIFNVLLAHRVIRPGLRFSCGSCHKEEWYHVSEFTEEYTCRYCFERQRVAFSSSAEWQYRADGMFQIEASAQGSIATILALWRLQHVGHSTHGRYVTGINFCDGTTVKREVDYCYIEPELFGAGYELVLGEAKSFVDYDAASIQRLLELADQFTPKPFLCFATLKDRFSDAEKDVLRAAVAKHYRVIPLTRLELDPYDLHDRLEGTRHKYVVSLSDLQEACVSLNL